MSLSGLMRVQLREDVSFSVVGMRMDFCCAEGGFTIQDASENVVSAFRLLSSGGSIMDTLRERFLDQGDLGGWLIFKNWLDRMAGLLVRSVETNGVRLATLVPLTLRTRLPNPLAVDGSFKLSRFAYIRRIGSRITLECPIGHAQVFIEDPRAMAIVYRLSQFQTIEELASETGLDLPAIRLLVGFLMEARTLTVFGCPDAESEDLGPALAHWEFHDLVFHGASRLGRRDLRYGGTYRFKGVIPPPPALRPDDGIMAIPLVRPDLDQAKYSDPPFVTILEQRRSIRQFGQQPIAVDALSEFLYRVARVKKVFKADAVSQELIFRAYPAGGAIHELEIYPVVARCNGLEAGIYRYNPAAHVLKKLKDRNEHVDALLSMAQRTLKQNSDIQILFIITARFQRVQWKYEAMAYALVLKNVGVLYQTMYLVATAMGLAPCALGGGDSDLFSIAAGLDYYAETSVGEFVLGTRGVEPAEINAPYDRKVNSDVEATSG